MAYAIKQLIQAGVRLFYYLEDRERTLDRPQDKLMLMVAGYADEMEREKARQRTADALRRKAEAGYVTGGRVFGYRNVAVTGPTGLRAGVVREFVPEEAEIVRRIFRMSADGLGNPTIAKTLNAEGAPCPRAQQGRPNGWAPSSLRSLLRNVLYRGCIRYGQTRKRNQWGVKAVSDRPRDEWLEHERPELRIVSEELWEAVQSRLERVAAKYPASRNGTRSYGVKAKHVLSGIGKCVCGASIEARTRLHGTRGKGKRVAFYGCSAYHRKGPTVCGNKLTIPAQVVDEAVLSIFESELFAPEVTDAILDAATVRLTAASTDVRVVDQRIQALETEIGRYVKLFASTPDVAQIAEEIQWRDREKKALQARRASVTAGSTGTPASIRDALQVKLEDWRGLLRRDVATSPRVLEAGLLGRLTFTADQDDAGWFYRISGEGSVLALAGDTVPLGVASPAASAPKGPSDRVELSGEMRRAA